MDASLIDLDTWARREHFEHYRRAVPCSYALTTEVDVTALVPALREASRRTYVAQIWALATIVNRHDEFRMRVDEEGRPAVWRRCDPAFTILNPDRETFVCASTPYDEDFGRFHDAASEVLDRHRDSTGLFPDGPPEPHCFDVSSIPWTSFTGFTLVLPRESDHLLPIFTLGRHVERDGRTLLPVSVQVHHAAADGFHTARLVEELGALLGDPSWVA